MAAAGWRRDGHARDDTNPSFMVETLTALGLIAVSFAATNFDNLALLVSWLLATGHGVRQVLVGHILGMGALLVIAIAFGAGAEQLPLEYVGFLGVIPILMGVRGLYVIARRPSDVTEKDRGGERRSAGPLAIAATQVANGVDSILVLGPLLADSDRGADFVMITGFAAMVLIWFGIARLLEVRAARLRILERYGEWLAPVVLIAVGLYILDNTATDIIAGH
jgi:cadmium resistance protein CadD (predicted permease)